MAFENGYDPVRGPTLLFILAFTIGTIGNTVEREREASANEAQNLLARSRCAYCMIFASRVLLWIEKKRRKKVEILLNRRRYFNWVKLVP